MSMTTKVLLAAAILFTFSVNTNAAQSTTLKADAQTIDTACQTEANTAGCPQAKFGKGLLKCLSDYKKSHKDFKVSAGCSKAQQQYKQDKKAGK